VSGAGGGGGSTGSTGGAGDAGADAPTNRDAASAGSDPFVFGQAPSAAGHFKKGINLGNRLEAPNEGDWGSKVLASDFPFIAKRGFDHVRIPIRWSGHAQTSAPYAIDGAFFSRIDTVLDQALAAPLAVILDMHAYDELASNPSGQRERFLALWSQIASRSRDRSASLLERRNARPREGNVIQSGAARCAEQRGPCICGDVLR
jgi:endoglucanase